MGDLPSFLKDKQNQPSGHRPEKKDMREKCVSKINKIKDYCEETYQRLSSEFHSQYDSPNVQKKKILGFYGHIVEELKKLQQASGENRLAEIQPPKLDDPFAHLKDIAPQTKGTKKAKPSAPKTPTKVAKTPPKKVAKAPTKAKEEKKEAKKDDKKAPVKKAASKKVAKKTVKKATKTTKAPVKKAPAKKSPSKKTAAKPAKKTAKKTAKKKK